PARRARRNLQGTIAADIASGAGRAPPSPSPSLPRPAINPPPTGTSRMTQTNEIVPFWLRLREISSYPFRGAALYTMLVLLVLMQAGVLPAIGWVIALVAWLAAYKYAFEVLRETADGRMESPEVVLSVEGGVVWRFIGLLLV